MLNRMKTGPIRQSEGFQPINFAALIPRLWVVLVVLAFPFIVICATYFEALERTGTMGAVIADTVMPAVIIGYMALIFILKKRKF